MDPKRLEKIEEQQSQILSLLERIEFGLLWFMDAQPDEIEDAKPSRPKRDRSLDFGDPARLKELRPKAWQMGVEAKQRKVLKRDNPYRDTRGGFRNAWFGGWEEGPPKKKRAPRRKKK